MALSKRMRFEILRRDNHACRYCGRAAPEVTLTVDHVIPATLGGTDEPANLVTACRDCNSGKSSQAADAVLVEDVAADAARWADALKRAVAIDRAKRTSDKDFVYQFVNEGPADRFFTHLDNGYGDTNPEVPRPRIDPRRPQRSRENCSRTRTFRPQKMEILVRNLLEHGARTPRNRPISTRFGGG